MGEGESPRKPYKDSPETEAEKAAVTEARGRLKFLLGEDERAGQKFVPGAYGEGQRALNERLQRETGLETDLTYSVRNNRDKLIKVEVVVDGVKVNAGEVWVE